MTANGECEFPPCLLQAPGGQHKRQRKSTCAAVLTLQSQPCTLNTKEQLMPPALAQAEHKVICLSQPPAQGHPLGSRHTARQALLLRAWQMMGRLHTQGTIPDPASVSSQDTRLSARAPTESSSPNLVFCQLFQ